MEIVLDKKAIEKCWQFAIKSAETQRPDAHGEQDSYRRSVEEIAKDTVIGKLGEVAVQSFFKEKGISFELDFEIYDRGEWDHSDIEIDGWKIDVKCTKHRGHNFLIEWNKLQFGADAGELPHFYLMTRLIDDDLLARDQMVNENVKVEVVGYIDTRELQESNKDLIVLNRGDHIPKTNVPMIAKSFCVPFEKLSSDWTELLNRIQKNEPFKLDQYEAPGLNTSCRVKNEVVIDKDPIKQSPKYSLLLSGEKFKKISIGQVIGWIKNGIKVFLFISKDAESELQNLSTQYGRECLNIYYVERKSPSLQIYDGIFVGDDFENLTTLSSIVSDFNFEQYLVEHASVESPIIVKASAGTGKTTVMVDRIMFLLAMDDTLQPSEIGMITFTNRATSSMLDKLHARLLGMYQLTNNLRWLELLENLGAMRLSTIDR